MILPRFVSPLRRKKKKRRRRRRRRRKKEKKYRKRRGRKLMRKIEQLDRKKGRQNTSENIAASDNCQAKLNYYLASATPPSLPPTLPLSLSCFSDCMDRPCDGSSIPVGPMVSSSLSVLFCVWLFYCGLL